MTYKDIIKSLPKHMLDKLLELKKLRERPDFHPEPSAWHHVEIVTKRCIQHGDPDLICAGIFHDIHKLDTMSINPKTGWPTSPGHDKQAQATIENDQDVRDWITSMGADPDTVAGICGQHMRLHQMPKMKESKQQKMRDLPFFDKLSIFGVFDNMLVSDDQAFEQLNQIKDEA